MLQHFKHVHVEKKHTQHILIGCIKSLIKLFQHMQQKTQIYKTYVNNADNKNGALLKQEKNLLEAYS